MKLNLDLNKLELEELETIISIAKKSKVKEKILALDNSSTVEEVEAEKPRKTFARRKRYDYAQLGAKARKILKGTNKPYLITELLDELKVVRTGYATKQIKEQLEVRGIRKIIQGKREFFVSKAGSKELKKDNTIKRKRKGWPEKKRVLFSNKLEFYKKKGMTHQEALRSTWADFKGEIPLVKESYQEQNKLKTTDLLLNFLKDSFLRSKEISEDDYLKFLKRVGRERPSWKLFQSWIITHAQEIDKAIGCHVRINIGADGKIRER